MVSMSLRRAILRLSGGKELSALCDQALVSGANFVTNVILARALGIREYGVFALSWMAVLFVASLQWAFIVSPMMSVGPKQEERNRPSYYGAVLIQEIAFAALSVAGMLIALRFSALHFPQWNIQGLGLPLSFAAFSYLLQDFVRRYFFSTGRSKFALLSDAISYLSQIPIIVLLSHRPNFSSSMALWIIGATSLVSFLAGWLWFEPVKFHALLSGKLEYDTGKSRAGWLHLHLCSGVLGTFSSLPRLFITALQQLLYCVPHKILWASHTSGFSG